MGTFYADIHPPSPYLRSLLRPMALSLSRLSSRTASFEPFSSAIFSFLDFLDDADDGTVASGVDRRPCAAPLISLARGARHGAGVPGIGHRLRLDEAQFGRLLFSRYE